jgi:hypothetical protein
LQQKPDGMIRDRTYSIRLYDADDLAALVCPGRLRSDSGPCRRIGLDPDLDVGCMNHRLVVVARKP